MNLDDLTRCLDAAEAALPPTPSVPQPQRNWTTDAASSDRYFSKGYADELADLASCPKSGGKYASLPQPKPGRNNHLNISALKLAKMPVSREKLHVDLVAAATTNGLYHEDPEGVEATIRSAFAKADTEPVRQAPEREAHAAAKLFDPGETPPAEPTTDPLAAMRSAEWLDRQRFAPLQYVVPGILPEGASILSAPPKIGKSWLALLLALETAAGGKVLGQHVSPRPVLYLALEDGDRRIKDRCRTLWGDQPLPRQFHYLLEVDPLLAVPTVLAFLDSFPGEQPLVIVDTLGRIKPQKRAGDESYLSDYQFAHRLRGAIATRPGAALLAIHHTRKAEVEDFVEAATGTMGLAGAFDSVLVLRRKRHEDTGVLLVSGRDVDEGRYALRMDDGRWELDGATLVDAAQLAEERAAEEVVAERTSRFGDTTQRVLKVVQNRADAGQVTMPNDVVQLTGLDQRVVANKLIALRKKGLVERTDYGAYTTSGPLCQHSGVVGVVGVVPNYTTESSTPLPKSPPPGTTPSTPLTPYREGSGGVVHGPACPPHGAATPTGEVQPGSPVQQAGGAL